MELKKEYPYNEAIYDFLVFLKRVVDEQKCLDEFTEILEDANKRQTFPMRGLHEKLMSYRKEHSDYKIFTMQEKEMIENLMHFWG